MMWMCTMSDSDAYSQTCPSDFIQIDAGCLCGSDLVQTDAGCLCGSDFIQTEAGWLCFALTWAKWLQTCQVGRSERGMYASGCSQPAVSISRTYLYQAMIMCIAHCLVTYSLHTCLYQSMIMFVAHCLVTILLHTYIHQSRIMFIAHCFVISILYIHTHINLRSFSLHTASLLVSYQFLTYTYVPIYDKIHCTLLHYLFPTCIFLPIFDLRHEHCLKYKCEENVSNTDLRSRKSRINRKRRIWSTQNCTTESRMNRKRITQLCINKMNRESTQAKQQTLYQSPQHFAGLAHERLKVAHE